MIGGEKGGKSMSKYYTIEATRQWKEDGEYQEEGIIDGAVCSSCYWDLEMGDDDSIHVRTLYEGAVLELGEDCEDACESCGEILVETDDGEV